MRLVSLALLVALLMAGCSNAPPTPAVDGHAVADAHVDGTTGAISGVVVDATIFPIAGATVTLTAQDQSATTNAGGQFVFELLAPGFYILSVAAPGYETVQSSAEVQAGQVSKPRIVLAIDSSPVPTPQTTRFEGWIEAADGWVSWILLDYTGNTELCQCEFNASVAAGSHTAILEVFWTPSNQANDPELWMDIDPPGGEWDGRSSAAPAYWRMDASSWEPGDARITFAAATTAAVQQGFEAFFTVWYHGEAPEGWSVAGTP